MNAAFLDSQSLFPVGLDFSPLHEAFPGLTLYEQTGPEQVAVRLQGMDCIMVNKVVLDAEALNGAADLKLILVAATGVNNVDIRAAAGRGITVCNCRDYGTDAVAQHVFALMLNLATQMHRYRGAVREGEWQRSPFFCFLDFPIMELAGKTLGIVGYGTLGQRVAALGEAFGMRVMIAARPGTADVPSGRVGFDQVIAESDFLSLHCPLTEDNAGLINADVFRHMKPGSFLINTARGGLVDEQALVDALAHGEIAGAGIDVISEEPPSGPHPLLAADLPNLFVTPHSAWGSREARQRIVEQMAENARAFAAGKPIRTVDVG